MSIYKLNETEVVLYKGDVVFSNSQTTVKLILTNQNIVFVRNESDSVDVNSVDNIKVYKSVPQIITKGHNVELYLKDKEIEFSFVKKSELNKFKTAALELLTGKTKAERRADKVKGSIELINNTINVDIVKETGKLITNNATIISTKIGDSAGKAIESVGAAVGDTVKMVGNSAAKSLNLVSNKNNKSIEYNQGAVVADNKKAKSITNAFKNIIKKKKQPIIIDSQEDVSVAEDIVEVE